MTRKTGEIIVPTEPASRATKITGFTFKSYDKNAGVLQFQIKNQDGSPTDLLGATVRLFMYIYQGEEKKEFPIFDNQIITESYMQGIVTYPIPDMLLPYEGQVDANIYIDFPDGSHTDNLAFTFKIEKSIIDGDVQLNGEYYFKDFKQLLDGVKQEAKEAVTEALEGLDQTIDDAKADVDKIVENATGNFDQTVDKVTKELQATQTNVDAVSKKVTSAQTNLTAIEDKLNQTNQQIGDLGKLKKMYSNSIDFGGYDYSGNPNLAIPINDDNVIRMNATTTKLTKHGTYVTVENASAGDVSVGLGLNSSYEGICSPLEVGKIYTVTIPIRINSDYSGDMSKIYTRVRCLTPQGATVVISNKHVPANSPRGEFFNVTATFTVPETATRSWSWWFHVGGQNMAYAGSFDISYDIKIEEGSVATPHQPNLRGEPFNISKHSLNNNLINTTASTQLPINTDLYGCYTGRLKENYEVGQTYTMTMKATKPGTQFFQVYLLNGDGNHAVGSMSQVIGLEGVWQLTFTVTQQHIDGGVTNHLNVAQTPQGTKGRVNIDWVKLEKGDTRTPNIKYYKYFGEGLKDSNNPRDYSWDMTPESIENSLDNTVSLTDPETVLGLKNFAEGLQSNGVNVAVEYAKAVDTDKYTKHGAVYLGGCVWLVWETLTFQKADGYAKGSYIRLGADGNASFTYSDVPNIFGGYLWLGGTCQPDYTDGGFGSYHITVENNFDDARKPIVRFVDSPTTPVKKLAVRGFALVFAPAPTENSQVRRQDDDERYLEI